jgi:hypothetical protein
MCSLPHNEHLEEQAEQGTIPQKTLTVNRQSVTAQCFLPEASFVMSVKKATRAGESVGFPFVASRPVVFSDSVVET